jgi:Tfp pilus assembly protein PilV
VSFQRRIAVLIPVREEHGWLIVEVMISAVVLILAGLAIYSGLDGASSASGRNRNRTEAAVLAQQDQERMRAMDTSALNAYIKTPNVQTLTVGGLTYTVTSNVAYANDTASSPSCTSATALASYLKISSTVSDPTNKNKPVTIDSLMSPRADQSGAAVQIVGRNGTTGIAGIPVSLDENSSLNDTTDSNGCVQFGFLKGTNYHVSYSKTGYVDADGNTPQTAEPITVVAGHTTLTQFQYDLAGAIRASFRDQAAGTVARGRGLTVFNTGLAGTQERSFLTGTGLTDAASAIATSGTMTTPVSLFPFTSAYSVWAGACDAAKPPAAQQRSATVTPGGTLILSPSTAYLMQPKLTVTVTKQTSSGGGLSNLQNADVKVTDVCGAKYPQMTLTNSSGVTTSGYPFGTLSVCADDNASTPHTASGTVTNTATGSAITLQINQWQSSALGQCT